MKKNILKIIAITFALALPTLVFAQTQVTTLKDLACLTLSYAGIVLFLIISLAVVVFVWNVYRYFIVADPENKKDAGLYVMYSVIGFVVIMSLWGMVYIVTHTLNIQSAPSSYWSVFPSATTCSNSSTSFSPGTAQPTGTTFSPGT